MAAFVRAVPATTTHHQEQKQRILDKYGGSEHLDVPDARLLVGQTESYVEYDRTGRVVKGAPKVRFHQILPCTYLYGTGSKVKYELVLSLEPIGSTARQGAW